MTRNLRIGEERSKVYNELVISDSGHETDALGHAGEEGRRRPRKSTGSCQSSVDPYVSEWGNPVGVTSYDHLLSKVGR